MARPDFTLKWAGSRLSIPAISAGNYAAGWDTYLGPLPPLGDDHDYVMNLQDSRAIWLGEQMLLAVGHEWQDDVTYDAYAITRSPVNGQLYRSLVGGNLNNEPSVSGAQWELGLGSDIPESLLTSGIAGAYSNLKASATGTNSAVAVTVKSVCLKNSSNEQVVLNNVSVSPSFANSGANGLDVGAGGSQTASTWYYIHLIWNETTVAGLLSLSDSAPALPSGYTYSALVSVCRTDATGNKYPISFGQIGDDWFYVPAAGSNLTTQTPIAASGAAGNANTPTYVAVAIGAYAPGRAVAIDARAFCIAPLANVLVAPNTSYTTQSSPPIRIAVGGTAGNAAFSISNRLRLESTNIQWASNDAAAALHIDGFKLGL